MEVPFTKLHGLGNDFLLIDAIDRPEIAARADWGSLAARWCDRHRGVGADGLLLLTRDPGGADAELRVINADGGDAQMCGNGVRCVARYFADRRAWGSGSLRVRTRRGVLDIRIHRGADGTFESATVDLGPPVLEPERVPAKFNGKWAIGVAWPEDLAEAWKGWASEAAAEGVLSCVSMGNPHAVVFCGRVEAVPLGRAGPECERHAAFPERTNVHFVQVESRSSARMISWERGVGATSACGTGACAVLVAGVLSGRMDRVAEMSLPGGRLRIEWTPGGAVLMTGPAEHVCRGVLNAPAPARNAARRSDTRPQAG